MRNMTETLELHNKLANVVRLIVAYRSKTARLSWTKNTLAYGMYVNCLRTSYPRVGANDAKRVSNHCHQLPRREMTETYACTHEHERTPTRMMTKRCV